MPTIAVIGAGAAGLAAAVTLAEAGARVSLLEARDRTGGRIWTETSGNHTVELGAEFIHGRHPVLWRWIERAGLKTYELDGAMLSYQEGKLTSDRDDRSQIFNQLDDLPNDENHDVSFGEWLAQQDLGEEAWRLKGYVEGFNAANADRISAAALVQQQAAEDATGGDAAWHIIGGYRALTGWMENRARELGVRVLLHSHVADIEWSRGAAKVAWNSGATECREDFARVIYTLPLALLQQRTVRISPEPQTIYAAANGLAMGNAERVSLVFRDRFWERANVNDAAKMSFLFAQGSGLPLQVFWTPHPDPAPIITGWIGGPRADSVESREQMEADALRSLATIFGIAEPALREELVSAHFHDWSRDPLARGAYSYVVNGGLSASRMLAEPVAKTLFFAGEHTDLEGHWGTVHAALNSGERAAKQVLESL